MHRRAATTTILAALAVASTIAPAAACTDGPADRGAVVEHLTPSDVAPTTRVPTGDVPTTAVPTTVAPTTSSPPTERSTDQADTTLALVQAVLDRYDAALTTLAADPLAAAPGHPSLEAWHAAVAPGSFSAAMLGDLVDRATAENVVVVPGPSGRSYRHQVLRAVEDGPTVSFTWCGHSPGTGIDVTTRAVVDDAVALSQGTGELSFDGTTWRVVTLDALDVEVAVAGTADPCPAELAATRAASDSHEVAE